MTDPTQHIPPMIGEKSPLNQSLKARQRIIAGLSWDEREDDVKFRHKVTNSDSQHDLDITCYVYNDKAEFIDFVGAEAQDSMDQSEKIYHSGDDVTGSGDTDDEFISVELADLPAHIHAIVFLVEIRSHHSFCDIKAPYTRLVDGMTNIDLLEAHINHDKAANEKAFVMCAIERDEDSENRSGWLLHNISEYPDITKIKDWGDYLSQFIEPAYY